MENPASVSSMEDQNMTFGMSRRASLGSPQPQQARLTLGGSHRHALEPRKEYASYHKKGYMRSLQLLTLALLATGVSALADSYQITFTLNSPGAEYLPAGNPINGLAEYGCLFYCGADGTVAGINVPQHPGMIGLIFGQDDLYFDSGAQVGSDPSQLYFDPNVSGDPGYFMLIAAVCFDGSGAFCLGALPPGDPDANIGPFGSAFGPNVTIVGTPTLTIDGGDSTFTMDFYNTLDPRVVAWYGVSSGEWLATLTYTDGIATIVDAPVPESSTLLLLTAVVGLVGLTKLTVRCETIGLKGSVATAFNGTTNGTALRTGGFEMALIDPGRSAKDARLPMQVLSRDPKYLPESSAPPRFPRSWRKRSL